MVAVPVIPSFMAFGIRVGITVRDVGCGRGWGVTGAPKRRASAARPGAPPAEDLLQDVDQPLKAEMCPKSGRPFLKCDYNRDGDSFRSCPGART